jgi:hypothetical protein
MLLLYFNLGIESDHGGHSEICVLRPAFVISIAGSVSRFTAKAGFHTTG